VDRQNRITTFEFWKGNLPQILNTPPLYLYVFFLCMFLGLCFCVRGSLRVFVTNREHIFWTDFDWRRHWY